MSSSQDAPAGTSRVDDYNLGICEAAATVSFTPGGIATAAHVLKIHRITPGYIARLPLSQATRGHLIMLLTAPDGR